MVVFYLLVLTFIALVAIGGFDATLRLVAYIDLLFRYQIVKVKMWVMMKKLESQLAIDHNSLIKELENKDG
jgi:hypothetical protein